jgi:hypothetical protein
MTQMSVSVTPTAPPHERWAMQGSILMDNVRFQFELPAARAKEIEELMRECGVETKKDFINNALSLLKWAIRETKRGNSIASVDEKNGKYREINMPILSAVAPPEEDGEETEEDSVHLGTLSESAWRER